MVQSNCVSDVITDNFETVRFEEISFKRIVQQQNPTTAIQQFMAQQEMQSFDADRACINQTHNACTSFLSIFVMKGSPTIAIKRCLQSGHIKTAVLKEAYSRLFGFRAYPLKSTFVKEDRLKFH